MSRLLAWSYDRLMRASEEACLADWRRELLRDVSGEVLEIGAGTGANLSHYPASLTRLVLAEPDPYMRDRLDRRLRQSGGLAEISDAPASSLPFPAESFDAVVSTLVLCSVPDPEGALAEIARVLRPGGRLIFLEHVAAEDRPERFKWQRRIEPLWRRVLGNCHITRRTGEAIRAAGFRVEVERRASIRKAAPVARPSIRGIAVKTIGAHRT
jgi:ubiquinone/menaquinone biosynthesis C-methylase UbiE